MSTDDREVADFNSQSDDLLQSKLFQVEGKSITPRPRETVCILDQTRTKSGGSTRVYAIPTPEPLRTEHDSDSDLESMSSEDLSVKSDDLELQDGNVHSFKYLDNLASVMVGTALKYALSDCSSRKCYQMIKDYDQLRNVYPDSKYFHLTRDNIDNFELICGDQSEHEPPRHNKIKSKEPKSSDQELKKEEFKKKIESEDDSLLDSDEDYDKDRDGFFRKNKKKYYLINKKGIEEFRTFLQGTLGEKNWNLWLDIDRAKLLVDDADLHE